MWVEDSHLGWLEHLEVLHLILCYKGGRLKCHIRYKGQIYFIPFLSIQQTNRCQLTAVAL